MPASRDVAKYLRGAACGLAAVSIWSGWIVVARLGLRSSLTPWDIAALRFGVAGLLMLPLVFMRGVALDRLGWGGLAAIVLGGAAPVFLANCGPDVCTGGPCRRVVSGRHAADGRAAGGGRARRGIFFGQEARLCADPARRAGDRVRLGRRTGLGAESRPRAFLCAGLAWAFYTVALRRARLDGLHAAAISAVGSALLYLPVYWALSGTTVAQASWFDIGLQAFVQGILTAIISLMLYGKAVSILGASSGAAFAALCPAMTAVMAIPVLGEWPQKQDWAAIVLISAGVYIVSGGPLPPVAPKNQ